MKQRISSLARRTSDFFAHVCVFLMKKVVARGSKVSFLVALIAVTGLRTALDLPLPGEDESIDKRIRQAIAGA